MSDDKKPKLKKFLVMNRGAVAGKGKQLIAGHGYEIGVDVSQETAVLMIRMGKGEDLDPEPKAESK